MENCESSKSYMTNQKKVKKKKKSNKVKGFGFIVFINDIVKSLNNEIAQDS